MKQKLLTVLFVATIAFVSVGSIITRDREFSDMENRVLEQLPEFTMQSFMDGDYGSRLEKYAADQIVLKDAFVIGKNHWDRLLGKRLVNNVYYTGERYIQCATGTKEQFEANVADVIRFGTSLENSYFLLAPTAAQVYASQLPSYAVSQVTDNLTTQLGEAYGDRLVYPLKELQANADKNIYYNTDHHWTMDGAHIAYQKLCTTLGLTAGNLSDMNQVMLQEEFLGSLYSQNPLAGIEGDRMTLYDYKSMNYTVTYPDRTTNSYLWPEKYPVKDKYTALFGGNYGRVVIENSSVKDKGTLLIFKDSYANSLVPYLIGNYSKIVMIDLRFYNDSCRDIVTKEGADTVLFMYNTDFLSSDNNFWKLGY